MPLKEQNASVFSGDDVSITVTITNELGQPLDLSNLTNADWQMSTLRADGTFSRTPSLQKSLSSGIVILDSANGRLEVTLNSVDTDALSGDFYHELQIIDSVLKQQTVMIGKLTIRRGLVQ